MNLLQLVLKQMRQRALSSILNVFSVLLAISLSIAIVIVWRGSGDLLGQKSYGFDLIVGTKGSPLQLVVNTVYHISTSPGNIPYTFFEQMEHDGTYRSLYRVAVPFAVGDSYQGLPIVGTLPRMFSVDDATGQPKSGYDARGYKLSGYVESDASDEETEAAGGHRRDPVFEFKPNENFHLAQGRPFARDKHEAVIGADVAAKTGLKLGDTFQATHGFPRPDETPDIHKPKWTVVGILEPTRTANDKCLYISLTSFYTIAEHGTGLVVQDAIRRGEDPELAKKEFEAEEKAKQDERAREKAEAQAKSTGRAATAPAGDDDDKDNYSLDASGNIKLDLPKEKLGLSGIMLKARGAYGVQTLKYIINNGQIAGASNPAEVMREFFANFIDNYSVVLLVVAALVAVVSSIGILVSIYNSVSARIREIAIFRALGATKGRVLALICTEAGLIGLFGAIGGILLGHLAAAIGSTILFRIIGQGFSWTAFGPAELLYFVGAILLSVLAGLVPATKAYRVPVATNLTA